MPETAGKGGAAAAGIWGVTILDLEGLRRYGE
jgi:hypothetical protein